MAAQAHRLPAIEPVPDRNGILLARAWRDSDPSRLWRPRGAISASARELRRPCQRRSRERGRTSSRVAAPPDPVRMARTSPEPECDRRALAWRRRTSGSLLTLDRLNLSLLILALPPQQ